MIDETLFETYRARQDLLEISFASSDYHGEFAAVYRCHGKSLMFERLLNSENYTI